MTDFEIVYSRHSEDVRFLDGAPVRVTVYNKGEPVTVHGAEVVDLPNVGLDVHSVLHHCAERYDDLAEVTLFICGSFRKRPENFWNHLGAYRVAEVIGFAGARFHPDEGWPGRIQHHSQWAEWVADGTITPSRYTLGDWWDLMMRGPRPERLWYVPGCTFGVRNDRIRARAQEWYRAMRNWFAKAGRYPEETHHMERMWLYVFGGCA